MAELVEAGSRDTAALQAAFTQAVHKWVLPAAAVVAQIRSTIAAGSVTWLLSGICLDAGTTPSYAAAA